MKKSILIFLLFISFQSFAQNDSIKFKNNNVLVGEIKTLLNGVLTMKTSYSDKDFKIEYKEVSEIYLNQTFLILLVNGGHYLGTAKTTKPGIIEITDDKKFTFETSIENLSQLNESGTKFWNRFKGNIDLGFNFTKSNNAVQFNLSSNLKYVGKRWNFNGSYSNTFNNQDDVDESKRVEWELDAQRFLFNDYYGIAQISFLSNTEQALEGRTTGLLGMGRYVVNTNRLYLGLRTGINYNVETFSDESLDKNSLEINLGTELNMFEYGDFNMLTSIVGYYGLTENNRFRFDYGINLKYDMPWDFYIKFDFSLNYDNQPADTGSELDYIFNSGFGWELK